jgi:formate C-acetyltransferase
MTTLCTQPVAADPPPRIRRLLDRRPPTGRERTWHPNGSDERAVLLWEYFQRSEGEPMPLRCARGLGWVLDHIAIGIHDDELLVGEVGLEDPNRTRPAEFAQAQRYWAERAGELAAELDSSFALQAMAHGLLNGGPGRNGHTIPAFDLLLTEGLGALRGRAQAAAATHTEADRVTQCQAMTVALDAVSAYIGRHVALAREPAATETQPARAAELQQIARVCEWVAHEAPRTFREALQLLWFAHLGIKLDDGGVGHSFGRFDQYLFPFYAGDLEAGRLTRDEAAELVALFWLKLNAEDDDNAHLSLGGQHADGRDATNDLSVLCLQAERWIGRKQPNLSTRVHAGTPAAYWRELARTIRCGAGHPAVFNDEVIVPGLVDHGFGLATARGYAQVGCVETYLPGLAAPWIDCYVNLAKCLELALNRGRDLFDGTELGPDPGDPTQFADFGCVFRAFEAQVGQVLHAALSRRDAYDAHVSRHAPVPFISALTPACLANGRDAVDGAPYILTGAYAVGLGTTVDSLAAIRALVFEDRLVTMADLLQALSADFVGHQATLGLCREHAPKYGNDDDRADQIAARIVDSFGRLMRAYPSPSSRAVHYGMVGSVVSHTSMGQATAASPNGRRAGETLSDGGSPSQGCNRSGATATLRSMAKPNYRGMPGGAALNLRLSPVDLDGEGGLDRLVALLKGYFEMGGEQLQVSVLDADRLRRARKHPDEHRDLVVRVAGFTAYFVSLPDALQREILTRVSAAI